MTNDNNTSNVPISNWTLATATRPGERYVYAAPSIDAHARGTLRASPPDRPFETPSR
jgi:hypothetical protein